jgi:hypothetical protein
MAQKDYTFNTINSKFWHILLWHKTTTLLIQLIQNFGTFCYGTKDYTFNTINSKFWHILLWHKKTTILIQLIQNFGTFCYGTKRLHS